MLIFIHNIILIYDICILLRMQSLRPRKGKKGWGNDMGTNDDRDVWDKHG